MHHNLQTKLTAEQPGATGQSAHEHRNRGSPQLTKLAVTGTIPGAVTLPVGLKSCWNGEPTGGTRLSFTSPRNSNHCWPFSAPPPMNFMAGRFAAPNFTSCRAHSKHALINSSKRQAYAALYSKNHTPTCISAEHLKVPGVERLEQAHTAALQHAPLLHCGKGLDHLAGVEQVVIELLTGPYTDILYCCCIVIHCQLHCCHICERGLIR